MIEFSLKCPINPKCIRTSHQLTANQHSCYMLSQQWFEMIVWLMISCILFSLGVLNIIVGHFEPVLIITAELSNHDNSGQHGPLEGSITTRTYCWVVTKLGLSQWSWIKEAGTGYHAGPVTSTSQDITGHHGASWGIQHHVNHKGAWNVQMLNYSNALYPLCSCNIQISTLRDE